MAPIRRVVAISVASIAGWVTATVGLAPRARAQPDAPRTGIVVRATHDPPVAPERVRAALLAAVGEGAVSDPQARARARLALGAVRAPRLALFVRAAQLADEGWRAYLSVEIEFAEARLVEARRVAVSLLDLQGGAELIADIALRLGAVRLQLGRPADAEAAFRLAAALDPDREVSVARFSPDVVAAYERAAAHAPVQVTARIRVSPPSAAIAIDGRAVEPERDEVRLAAGQHAVSVTAPGFRPYAELIDVTGAADPPWSIALEPDPLRAAVTDGELAVGQPEAAARRAVESLLIFGELDAVVIAAPAWRFGAPALLAQRCAGIPARCGPVVELAFGAPDALAAAARTAWTAMLDSPRATAFDAPTLLVDRRLVAGETRPVDRPPPPPTRPWYKNGWLWVAVSGTALAVTAAIVFGDGAETTTSGAAINPCEFGGPACL